jgi:hypothetical protein
MLSGIGRFLRLTVSNIRLRIAYEDFPSTDRLVALVQVMSFAGTIDEWVVIPWVAYGFADQVLVPGCWHLC